MHVYDNIFVFLRNQDTVYRGLEPVSKEEVLKYYEGGHVSLTKLGTDYAYTFLTRLSNYNEDLKRSLGNSFILRHL